MSYHDLSSCTLNDDERRAEADRILGMLTELDEDVDGVHFSEKEEDFLEHIGSGPVSVKQLFWLRDLKAKYLE